MIGGQGGGGYESPPWLAQPTTTAEGDDAPTAGGRGVAGQVGLRQCQSAARSFAADSYVRCQSGPVGGSITRSVPASA